jgi:DNA-binding MltR family transcriptional regulator
MSKKISTEFQIATYASLLRESDKGCLLLAVGIVDKQLRNILETAILSNLKGTFSKSLQKDLFEGHGPVCTLSQRINIAYAFCLLSRKEYEALHVLRDLRNEAAHCFFDYSFDDPGVVAHLKKLPKRNSKKLRECFVRDAGIEVTGKATNKFVFVVSCYALLHELHAAYVKQVHRYATKVRGIKIPRLKKLTGISLAKQTLKSV